MAYLKAQKESEDRHRAATRISLMYRSNKAKRIVKERRIQHCLEDAIKEMKHLHEAPEPLQRAFRRYSTRRWLAELGVVFRLNRRKKRKVKAGQKSISELVSKETIRARVVVEVQRRRVCQRLVLFHKLWNKYADTAGTLETNIRHWLDRYLALPSEVNKLQVVHDQFMGEHAAEMAHMSEVKTSTSLKDYDLMEMNLRRLMVRVEGIQQRIENAANQRWWIAQLLRANYRRKAAAEVRYQDTMRRLEWIAVESAIVHRIVVEMDEQYARLSVLRDAMLASNWLERYRAYAMDHLALLDSQQETVLKEEYEKMAQDELSTKEFDSLMMELTAGLHAHSQYFAERVLLEQQVLVGPASHAGTEASVEVNQRRMDVKRKLNALEESVLDNVRRGLQDKFDNEEQKNTLLYGFPTDKLDLSVENFQEITAVLVERFVAPPHIKIEEFFTVFMVQPWLAEHTVGDVRIEEEVTKNEILMGKAKEELDALHFKISEFKSKIKICDDKVSFETSSLVESLLMLLSIHRPHGIFCLHICAELGAIGRDCAQEGEP